MSKKISMMSDHSPDRRVNGSALIDRGHPLPTGGSTTPARLLAFTERGWAVKDCPKISTWCDTIEGFIVQARRLLHTPE